MGYNIAHFGAFDIDSYGDSLFAEVLSFELSKRIEEVNITLFSINSAFNKYNDKNVYSYSDFDDINSKNKFDVIIIGGGEFVHYKPIIFTNENDEKAYSSGQVWRFPVQKSIQYDIPVIFNGVGVPFEISEENENDFIDILSNTNYLAIRDSFSFDRVSKFCETQERVIVIPDTVFSISNMYTKEELSKVYCEMNYDLDKNERYICVQYGTTFEIGELISQLKAIKNAFDYKIVLLPINHCHEDFKVLSYIKSDIGEDVFLYDNNLEIKQIMAIIANAEIFIGTSLHGSLTAMVYGVKCIALDMYHSFASKIDGLYNMVELTQKVVPEPSYLYPIFVNSMNDNQYETKIKIKVDDFKHRLSIYFDTITNLISNCKSNIKIKVLSKDNKQLQTNINFKKIAFEYPTPEGLMSAYEIIKSENNIYTASVKNVCTNKAKIFIFIEEVSQIEIIEANCDNKECELKCYNNFEKNENRYIFTDSKPMFEISQEEVFNDITIKFITSEFELEKSHEILKKDNINKKAHINMLINSERKLNSELSKIEREMEEKNDYINLLREKERQLNNVVEEKINEINMLMPKNKKAFKNIKYKFKATVTSMTNIILPINTKRRSVLIAIKHLLIKSRK